MAMARRGFLGRSRRDYQDPEPHPSGARPPKIPGELVPDHVAIVMDGNGRWAKERGLPRTEGHKVGAERVLDVLQGAVEMGVGSISLYAFSTENWRRSPGGALPDELQPRLHPQDPRPARRARHPGPLGGPHAQAVEVGGQGAQVAQEQTRTTTGSPCTSA